MSQPSGEPYDLRNKKRTVEDVWKKLTEVEATVKSLGDKDKTNLDEIEKLRKEKDALQKTVDDLSERLTKLEKENKETTTVIDNAKRAAAKATADAVKKQEATQSQLQDEINRVRALAKSKNVVIKNCKSLRTRGKPEEVSAAALEHAKAVLSTLDCPTVIVKKAVSHTVEYTKGAEKRSEVIVVATLASEEEAAKIADASLKKWQEALKEAGGDKSKAERTTEVRRDLTKRALAIMDAMRDQKNEWRKAHTYAKVSYDIVDGMPRMRVKPDSDGRWITCDTLVAGRDRFRFVPREKRQGGQRNGTGGEPQVEVADTEQ